MASKYFNLILILFILLTSLPSLLFMIYYEKILEKTLIESIKILTYLNPPSNNYFQVTSIYWAHSISMTPEFTKRLISLTLLHLFPRHLLELLSVITTVHFASKMQKDQQPSKVMTFREVIRDSWLIKDRIKGILVTSIYVLFLSSCALVGFIWISIVSYTMRMTYFFDPMFTIVYPIGILFFLVKFLELSAVWNMSLAISVMMDIDALTAFPLAFYFNKGNERRGLFMMFLFFALGLGFRIPCLFEGEEDREVAIVTRSILLWVLHLVKWMACTWYYFWCKNRVLQKKADLQVQGKV